MIWSLPDLKNQGEKEQVGQVGRLWDTGDDANIRSHHAQIVNHERVFVRKIR
jgi:hypothetical protein